MDNVHFFQMQGNAIPSNTKKANKLGMKVLEVSNFNI